MNHHNKDLQDKTSKTNLPCQIMQKHIKQEFKVRKAHPKLALCSIVIHLKPQIIDCSLQCWFWFSTSKVPNDKERSEAYGTDYG